VTRYLLNSAVLGEPGLYRYDRVSTDEARSWLLRSGWQSRIGYPENARVISLLAGVRCPLSRDRVTMAPGDEALVMRLRYRVTDPATKGVAVDLALDEWEWGTLECLDDAANARLRVWRLAALEAIDLLSQSRHAFRSKQIEHARRLLEKQMEEDDQ